MPLLNHFFFYCSVRLGTIFSGLYAGISSVICLYFLGIGNVNDIKEYIIRHDVLKKVEDNIFVHQIVDMINSHLKMFLQLSIVLISLHLFACIFLIIGALKLNKYLIMPFIILNMGKVFVFLIIHIIAMIFLKKQLPLGELIATTCAGGFCILFYLYMWTSSVALYQQIGLIQSEKYRLLYKNLFSKNVDSNILQVDPAKHLKGKEDSIRPYDNNTNMLFKDFMSIYSRKKE